MGFVPGGEGDSVCRKVLLMGDRGESAPLKADKYLCVRGDTEQASQQQKQINTFSSNSMVCHYNLLTMY